MSSSVVLVSDRHKSGGVQVLDISGGTNGWPNVVLTLRIESELRDSHYPITNIMAE